MITFDEFRKKVIEHHFLDGSKRKLALVSGMTYAYIALSEDPKEKAKAESFYMYVWDMLESRSRPLIDESYSQ